MVYRHNKRKPETCPGFLSAFLNLIQTGERIAQGALRSVPQVEIEEVKELSESERGERGFGSSGY